MDGVIAAKAVGFGKVPGGVRKHRVQTDDVQLEADLVDPGNRTTQGRQGDTASGYTSWLDTTDSARSHNSAASSDPGSSKTSLISAEVSK